MLTYAAIAVVENPVTSEDEEFIVLADGFSEQELAEEEPPDESLLHFAMLVIWRSVDWESAQAQIQEHFESETSKILSLDLVSDDVCRLTRQFRRVARKLEPECGFLFYCSVGFKKGCDSAQAEAFLIIRMVALRKRWQFWR